MIAIYHNSSTKNDSLIAAILAFISLIVSIWLGLSSITIYFDDDPTDDLFWLLFILSLALLFLSLYLKGFSLILEFVKKIERRYNMTEAEKIDYDISTLESIRKEQKEGCLRFNKNEVLNFFNVLINPIPFPILKTFHGYIRFIGRDIFAVPFKTFLFIYYPFLKLNIISRQQKLEKKPNKRVMSFQKILSVYLSATFCAITIYALGFYVLPDYTLKNKSGLSAEFIIGAALIIIGFIFTSRKSLNLVFEIKRKNGTKNSNVKSRRINFLVVILPLIILFSIGTILIPIKFQKYSLFKKGKIAIKDQKWDQAEAIFTELTRSGFIECSKIGDIFYDQNQYELSYKYYQCNQYITSYYKFVLSAFNSGDFDAAYREAWFSIKARGDYSGHEKGVLIYILGRVSQHRNDMPSAVQHYSKSLELLSDYELKNEINQRLLQIDIASGLAKNNYQVAVQKLNQNKYDEAYLLFENIYLSVSDYNLRFKAYHYMGYCKKHLGDYISAKNIFLEILSKIRIKEKDKEFFARCHYATIGRGFWQEKNYKKGIEYTRKAFEILPNNLSIRNQLAWYLITTKDKSLYRPNVALEIAIETNIMDNGQNPYFIDTLAGCYASIGDFDNAVFYSQKAVELAKANKVDKNLLEENLKSYKINLIPWESPHYGDRETNQ